MKIFLNQLKCIFLGVKNCNQSMEYEHWITDLSGGHYILYGGELLLGNTLPIK